MHFLNGNLFNGESFARSLGVSAPTVNRYLDFLEGGFLIRRLQPWFVNAKKRLVKSPKTYIRDTGVLHRLLNIPSYSDLFGHPGIGASWEGYVVEQIYQIKEKQTDFFFIGLKEGQNAIWFLYRELHHLHVSKLNYQMRQQYLKVL
ncbi:DUF4143 domain-containing protein [Pedobacter sp. SG908]|uniref:DUF4143 domain-containing protein n=1 Tax=Pedobacter sp. SG908 TaxID=2587135 RepID=UPI003262CCDE